MANKFTKSVLERQAKEAKQSRSHPNIIAAPTEQNTAPPDIQPEPQQTAPAATPPKPASPAKKTAKAVSQVDLSAFIIRDNERSAKNKTFYLDAAVIEAIKSAASAQKVTDSKLVNDILKKILGVK